MQESRSDWLNVFLNLQVGRLRDERPSVASNPVPVFRLLPSGEEAERLRELPHGDRLREQPHLQDVPLSGVVPFNAQSYPHYSFPSCGPLEIIISSSLPVCPFQEQGF